MTENLHPQITEIEQAHHGLLQKVAELDLKLSNPGTVCIPEVVDQLKEVQIILLEHFRLEEKDGYLDLVLEHKPYLKNKLDGLLEQHRELEAELETLLVEPASSRSEDFPRKVQKWIGRLRHHEREENLLVEDAFNEDIGSAD